MKVIEARRAAKHVEFRKIKRRARYLKEKSGLTAALKTMDEAHRNEERAAVAVLLAVPGDNAADAAKTRHMRRHDIFKSDWCEGADLMGALKLALGVEA